MWLKCRHHSRIVFKEIEDIRAGLWDTRIQVTGEPLDQVRHLELLRLNTVDENWIGWKITRRDLWRFRPQCRDRVTRVTVSNKGLSAFEAFVYTPLIWFKKAQLQGDVRSKKSLGIAVDLHAVPSKSNDHSTADGEMILGEGKHHRFSEVEGASRRRTTNDMDVEGNEYVDQRQEEEEELHLEGKSKEEEEEMSQGQGEIEGDQVEDNTVVSPKFGGRGLESESEPTADSTMNEKQSSDVEEFVVPTRRTYLFKQ